MIATETYANDPVLVAPKGGSNPNPLFRYPPVPAHVQFGGTAPQPTAPAQQQVMVKNVPQVPVVPKVPTAPPPTTSSSATTTASATDASAGAKPAGTTQHQFVRNPKATGNRSDIPSGVPKAKANPVVPTGTRLLPLLESSSLRLPRTIGILHPNAWSVVLGAAFGHAAG